MLSLRKSKQQQETLVYQVQSYSKKLPNVIVLNLVLEVKVQHVKLNPDLDLVLVLSQDPKKTVVSENLSEDLTLEDYLTQDPRFTSKVNVSKNAPSLAQEVEAESKVS
jgi:hypothetical protein